MRRRPVIRRFLPLALAVLGVVALVGTADVAGALEIDVDAPASTRVGETVEITVSVTDDTGAPVEGARVVVSTVGRIVGEGGPVPLAGAVTGDDGTAVLTFVERAPAGGNQDLRIEASVGDETADGEVELAVAAGPQLHDPSAPVHLPFSVWWILAVIGLVWFLLISATWRLLEIGRASTSARGLTWFAPRWIVGFVTFTAVGMFVVVLNRPQAHANLEPGRDFDRVPVAHVGAEYDYAGLGLPDADVRGGLDGRQLYVRANCAGCHGIPGESVGVVGGELRGSILDDPEEFIEEVRRGPRSMPAFGPDELTDAEITRIVEYLNAAHQ